jgi:GrpB-like predicted nucleotidyltransferase (UPF0157 family)
MSHASTHRPYELEAYNPEWKQWFETRCDKIAPLIGENLISIEHIGSTSIPGMLAKPNIDILVVVTNLDHVTERLQLFIDAGFTPQGREYVVGGEEYITEDTKDGKRITSIHVVELGNPKIVAYREFREYLTVHEEDRNLYIELKKKLYADHSENYRGYDLGKTETIEAIKKRAHAWAEVHLPK